MKRLFKKNQIIITALAIMIAAAGYFNYAEKNIIKSTGVLTKNDTKEENKDEDLAVDSEVETIITESDITDITDITDATDEVAEIESDTYETDNEENATSEPGEAVFTSSEVFSADAKLNREQLRAKNEEALMQIINNESLSDEQKQQAVDTMVNMTKNSENEDAVEMLLEAKGFGKCVVTISDNSVDIVMDMTNITDVNRAQIEEIVSRKTGCSPESIVITPLN